MILLDQDLDPDPALKAASAKRGSVRRSRQKSSDFRLPSARTLARFLKAGQEAVRLKGQVTVLLTTDAAIRDLNRRFRGKNKATDVLSFPAEGLGAEGIAGDLAISVTTALGQAAEQGHSLATEIKVLVLHGLLHLAGFDHEADEGQMARRERVLRGRLGLPMGLIERGGYPTLSPERRRKDGARGIEVSHPRSPHGRGPVHRDPDSRKNKGAARVGRPLTAKKMPEKRISGANAQNHSAVLIVGVKTPTHRPRAAAAKGKRA
jgi:probable rRNA maturation factor